MRNGGRVHYIHPLAILAFFSAFTGTVASLSATYFWPPKHVPETNPVEMIMVTGGDYGMSSGGGGGAGGGYVMYSSCCTFSGTTK